MKSLMLILGGIAGTIAYLLVKNSIHVGGNVVNAAPVEELAHKLQDAWADHHTVA